MLKIVPVVVIALLALTACGSPGTPGADPAPTVTVTVTATPEPVLPSTTPDYGFSFFEEAQLGGTWGEISSQLHYPVAGPAECPWYAAVWNTDLGITYAFTDSGDPGSGVSFFYTQSFLAPAGSPFPQNAEGVGIGSTQAELLAAYPSAVVGTQRDPGAGDLATVTVDDPDSDSRYVFAFSGGSSTVDLLQWGTEAGNQWSHLCTGF